MSKFPSPSWCCFSSPSSPTGPSTPPPSSQQSANARSSTPASSQPSQQAVIAGLSTRPSSSQPSQQPPNVGTSTPPSSSQASQQPVIAGPSTPPSSSAQLANARPSTPPFSSQSSPQPVIAGPSTPPSSSAQLANAGPSTPPFSSQSSPQPVNVGLSTPPSSAQPSPTPPSSSQPSPQLTNVVTPTATTTDLQSSLGKFKNISQLNDLIKFIEDRLMIALGEKNGGGPSSEVISYIQDGQTLLEFVDKHIQKKDYMEDLGAETKKILINLLKGCGKIHWAGAALSVVGFALSRYSEMSDNKRECFEFLKAMVNLGKQIVELYDQMPDQEQKLNEAVECIVEGCSICASQITTIKIFRFFTTSVTADSLKTFQRKIDRLYDDLGMWVNIDIQKRLPKTAPQSQEIYANQWAAGIDNAREEVIRLLDLGAQPTSPQAVVVVVHGFGGIGKTTIADSVYAHINLQSYKHCRILMIQNCTDTDLKDLQEQILKDLFNKRMKLDNCDQGRGLIRSHLTKNRNQPLFLYIDNGLKIEDFKKLLPADMGSCLSPKSRILLTTRFLQEADIFLTPNIQREAYEVSPLPSPDARKVLLKNVPDYKDENNIDALLNVCGGVPLLLEIIGSQLARCIRNADDMEIVEMIREGKKVEKEDLSDRMVDFVYRRLWELAQEAFLDITAFFSKRKFLSKFVAYFVGEEQFRALVEASFVKTDENGYLVAHDIVRARGRKISEASRITDPMTLSECLENEKILKKLKGIYFDQPSNEPAIEVNERQLRSMSSSLRILYFRKESLITFTGKCPKPFKQLRYLSLPSDSPDLPMKEFDKLEHLVTYRGPFTQDMSFYELPRNLRLLYINNMIYSENGDANSKIPSENTPPNSSLGELRFVGIPTMERLPDGLEKLTKLEQLLVHNCPELRELPLKIGELKNLEKLELVNCPCLEEWPLSFGDLSKLKTLRLSKCSSKFKESLPHSIKVYCNIIE